MTTPFLTISEAAEKSGRSLSTIRRIVRTIGDNASHPDRDGVEPSPAQVAEFKKKGEIFTWKVRGDVLDRQLKSAQKTEKKSDPAPHGDILDILRRELELKNGQIEKQWEVIHALNDRLREGNILMGSLQQRLALPEGTSKSSNTVEASVVKASKDPSAEPAKAAKTKASASSSTGAVQKDSKKASRRGLLKWLVG
jgi:hypothetical protein